MLQTVEGIYRDGKIELSETPEDVREARVIVTFLPSGFVDLAARGITEAQAADFALVLVPLPKIGNALK